MFIRAPGKKVHGHKFTEKTAITAGLYKILHNCRDLSGMYRCGNCGHPLRSGFVKVTDECWPVLRLERFYFNSFYYNYYGKIFVQ